MGDDMETDRKNMAGADRQAALNKRHQNLDKLGESHPRPAKATAIHIQVHLDSDVLTPDEKQQAHEEMLSRSRQNIRDIHKVIRRSKNILQQTEQLLNSQKPTKANPDQRG